MHDRFALEMAPPVSLSTRTAVHCTDVALLSDKALLEHVAGQQAADLYRGSLKTLFEEHGPAQHKCLAARELVKRWLAEELRRECALSAPESVRDYLRTHFCGQQHETFVALFLDSQNRLIAADELFQGTLTQTSVYPREVVKAALKHNAAALILAHNHPSGVAEPSVADELLTRNLKQALALVDVRVLDHFIVAGYATVSLAERGLV
jgi:DNA repair protein RadC